MGEYEVIVADTHIIIWDALVPQKLSKNAKTAISRANNDDGILFCEISLWEIAMLINRGRIRIDVSYKDFIHLILKSKQYILQGITPEIAELTTQIFQNTEQDPADRLIAATAIVKRAELVTADKTMRHSKEVRTIW